MFYDSGIDLSGVVSLMLFKLAILLVAFSPLNLYSQPVRKQAAAAPAAERVVSRSTGDGGLERHLSAAQTYQLAGDLEHASIENRAVLGIVLRQAGLLELEQGN